MLSETTCTTSLKNVEIELLMTLAVWKIRSFASSQALWPQHGA